MIEMDGLYCYEQNIEMLDEKDISKNCAYQNKIPVARMLSSILVLTTDSLAALLSLRLLLLLGERMHLVYYNYHITI
jgi:hypothetical protein